MFGCSLRIVLKVLGKGQGWYFYRQKPRSLIPVIRRPEVAEAIKEDNQGPACNLRLPSGARQDKASWHKMRS